MSVSRYAPGTWLSVVAPGFVAFMDGETPIEIGQSIWDAASRNVDVISHLEIVATDRFDRLAPFALVRFDTDAAHVIARGAMEIEIDGGEHRTVSAPDAMTWSEASVSAPTAITVRAPDYGEISGELPRPLIGGIVSADAVHIEVSAQRPEPTPQQAAQAGAPAPAQQPRAAETSEHAPSSGSSPAPAAPAALAADGAPAASGPDGAANLGSDDSEIPVQTLIPDDDDHAATNLTTPAGGAATPAAAAPAASASFAPAVDSDSVDSALASAVAAPTPTQAEATPTPESAIPGTNSAQLYSRTVMIDDVMTARAQLAEINRARHAAAASGTSVITEVPLSRPLQVLVSTGLRLAVDRPVLVGRQPEVTDPNAVHVVALNSSELAPVQIEIKPGGDQYVTIVDRSLPRRLARQVAAVAITAPGGQPTALRPGESVRAVAGTTVQLGEGFGLILEAES